MLRILPPLACALFAACILLTAARTGRAAADPSPAAPSPAKDDGRPAAVPPLKVTTANLRNSHAKDGVNDWAHRKAALLAHLKAVDSDVLGVQEAYLDQKDDVAGALPGYAVVGVGRNDGKKAGEHSALYVRSARLAVVDSGTFWLSPTPEVVGSVGWDAALTRICSWALVRDVAAGRELLLANTHFDHMGNKARAESAKLIATRLPKLYPGRPLVVTGDFNSDDDSSAYTTIVGIGLTDAYREVHPKREPNEASFNGFKPVVEGTRIDFVFHTPELKCTAAEIDRTRRGAEAERLFLTDHYLVHATLAWK